MSESKRVPREPTEAMIGAGRLSVTGWMRPESAVAVWRAMYHAAPAVPDERAWCIWEDCDQEAIYCEGHAKEYAAPTIDASDEEYESLLARAEAAERERDRAVEVADAETKGVYSKYMLEAADAIADMRYLRTQDDPIGELARMMEKVDKVQSECARLRQDAERYRWLRKNRGGRRYENSQPWAMVFDDDLERHIDRAIAEGKHEA